MYKNKFKNKVELGLFLYNATSSSFSSIQLRFVLLMFGFVLLGPVIFFDFFFFYFFF